VVPTPYMLTAIQQAAVEMLLTGQVAWHIELQLSILPGSPRA